MSLAAWQNMVSRYTGTLELKVQQIMCAQLIGFVQNYLELDELGFEN